MTTAATKPVGQFVSMPTRMNTSAQVSAPSSAINGRKSNSTSARLPCIEKILMAAAIIANPAGGCKSKGTP